MSDLFLVPRVCQASKVCYLVLTGQTVCEALFLFDRINIAFRSRRLNIHSKNVLKPLSQTVLWYFIRGHSL